MRKNLMIFITGIAILSTTNIALAGWFDSAVSTVKQTVAQKMTPEAQTTVDEAKKLQTPKQQENFIITAAKKYLGEGKYQTALDLANYVKTALNSKSLDAKSIISTATSALTKMLQK